MRLIQFLVLLIPSSFLFTVVLSNSGGPGKIQNKDRTGSPVATLSCAACHDGPDYEPAITIRMLQNGLAVNEYEPGALYQLEIEVNARQGTPSGYGMQAVVMDNSTASAGLFGTPIMGTQISFVNGRPYFEHDRLSVDNTFSIDWTAPNSGTGPVKVYAAAVAVNGNGESEGDGSVKGQLSLSEMTTTSTDKNYKREEISLVNSLVNDVLLLNCYAETPEHLDLGIYDAGGKLLRTYQYSIAGNQSSLQINVGSLPAGLFVLKVDSQGERKSFKFVKL